MCIRDSVRIVLGNEVLETISPAKTTVPGLGYIKKTFTDKKTVNTDEIIVEKRDTGIAWGAVYAQFEENLDKVVRQGSGLNVDKKLYVETIVNNLSLIHISCSFSTNKLFPDTDNL